MIQFDTKNRISSLIEWWFSTTWRHSCAQLLGHQCPKTCPFPLRAGLNKCQSDTKRLGSVWVFYAAVCHSLKLTGIQLPSPSNRLWKNEAITDGLFPSYTLPSQLTGEILPLQTWTIYFSYVSVPQFTPFTSSLFIWKEFFKIKSWILRLNFNNLRHKIESLMTERISINSRHTHL